MVATRHSLDWHTKSSHDSSIPDENGSEVLISVVDKVALICVQPHTICIVRTTASYHS